MTPALAPAGESGDSTHGGKVRFGPAASLLAYIGLSIVACSSGSNVPSGQTPKPGQSAGTGAGSGSVLNVYNWADFIDPSVVSDFEREFGIKVNYDVYESNEMMEVKLLAGHANYDVVVPGGAFLEKEIRAGVYQKLRPALLPNLKNLDAGARLATAVYDPGNQYGVDYMWLVTTGLGYDVTRLKARLADAPLDSWRLLLDPDVAAKFRDCGISVLDAPQDVLGAALAFLGKDPNSESLDDLQSAEKILLAVRPYIRYVDSSRYIEDLANGEICLALGWSGDVVQARRRAHEAGKTVDIVYVIPKEGSLSIADALTIPSDAPHPENAHLFINFLLRPEVAARNAMATSYASGVAGSVRLLSDAARSDPAMYPPPEVRARLVAMRAKSQEFTRSLMRMWTRFKTGQ